MTWRGSTMTPTRWLRDYHQRERAYWWVDAMALVVLSFALGWLACHAGMLS